MIVLIRHGETLGNAKRVLQHPETPLSDRGLAQASRLGERMTGANIAAIWTSDYARARMTAQAVSLASDAPLSLDPLLRERNFGELRGRAYADLGFDPFAPDYTPPGGESWDDLHERVDEVWARIVAAAAAAARVGDLVVVTHGLVCHSLTSRIFDLSEVQSDITGFGNTSVTLVDGAHPHTVRLLGCTAHLDDATAHDRRTVSGL